MRVTYDDAADAAYIYLRAIAPGDIADTLAVEPRGPGTVNLDMDSDGKLVGIEVLAASRRLPAELLATAERP